MTTASLGDLRPAAVRGECPSVHAPFLERDGALMRIRVPGGALTSDAARVVADVLDAARGTAIELTNRANLQLRGLPPAAVAEARDRLVASGLVDADPAVDEHRNVLTSPMAGVDPDELLDPRHLVADISRRLTRPDALGSSPKFGVLVDGGGAVHIRDRAHDLALGATRDTTGRVWFEVGLASALGVRRRRSDARWFVDPAHVDVLVDAVIALTGDRGRVRTLLDTDGEDAVWRALVARTGGALVRRTDTEMEGHDGPTATPVGVRRERRPGRVSVGAIVPLGRIEASAFRAIAGIADAHGSGELRLSPWRQIVVVGVATGDGRRVADAFEQIGCIVDASHPAGMVVVCAGARGCASGHTDTLSDAAALIHALGAIPPASRPESIHVSGCEKGCACPERTAIALVGTTGATYDVHRDLPDVSPTDPTEARFGHRVSAALRPVEARRAATTTTTAPPSTPPTGAPALDR